jgi:hypothetical protein
MYKLSLTGFGQVAIDGDKPPAKSPSAIVFSPAGPLPARLRYDRILEPISYRALRRVYRTAALAGCSCVDE